MVSTPASRFRARRTCLGQLRFVGTCQEVVQDHRVRAQKARRELHDRQGQPPGAFARLAFSHDGSRLSGPLLEGVEPGIRGRFALPVRIERPCVAALISWQPIQFGCRV